MYIKDYNLNLSTEQKELIALIINVFTTDQQYPMADVNNIDNFNPKILINIFNNDDRYLLSKPKQPKDRIIQLNDIENIFNNISII